MQTNTAENEELSNEAFLGAQMHPRVGALPIVILELGVPRDL